MGESYEQMRKRVVRKLRAQKRKGNRNGIIIVSSVIIIVWGVYKLSTTIWDPVEVKGYAYAHGLTPLGGRGGAQKLTVFYMYEYEGEVYLPSKSFYLTNNITTGDSLIIQLSASNPEKHKIVDRFYNDILNVTYK